jgi:SAM-dependent methyltransferase
MNLGKKLRRLLGRPEPFRAKNFGRRDHFRDDYHILATALLELLDFESIIDVGCATGLLLSEMDRAGKSVRGIELSPEVVDFLPLELKDKVLVGDFSTVDGRADLASSIEVAEHIVPSRSEELVDVLTSISTRWIFFTAASPGQRGLGHINCRPMEDWAALFEARGWEIDTARTESLRTALEKLERAVWLRGNSVIFRERRGT